MSKELDGIFVDVRNAFRLLTRYQKRVLNIVDYIRAQTPFTDMWGSKNWYSDEIRTRRNSPDPDYAKLSVWKDMWGLDFLYGHFFEYYYGSEKIEKHTVEMSVFQVSDDGFFISNKENKSMTDVSSYAESEISHSYIIMNVSVYNVKLKEPSLWLHDLNNPDDDWKDFLTKFLGSSNDCMIQSTDKECMVIKKYEMQRFATQEAADDVISDFAKLLQDKTGIKLFKEVFYRK